MTDRDDIVSRLRWPPIPGEKDNPISVQLRIEAASEITRLREALREVCNISDCHYAIDVARAALSNGDERDNRS